MVMMNDRAAYWQSVNGVEIFLDAVEGGFSVSKGQGITDEDLEAIPEATIEAWQEEESQKTVTKEAKEELIKIDAASTRQMREFILSKFPDDPLLSPYLAENEDKAKAERLKIK